jgi:hypothetical protein
MCLGSLDHWRLHKLEKLLSDPYLLYLANKNMLKLKKCYSILELALVDYHENETWCKMFKNSYIFLIC